MVIPVILMTVRFALDQTFVVSVNKNLSLIWITQLENHIAYIYNVISHIVNHVYNSINVKPVQVGTVFLQKEHVSLLQVFTNIVQKTV